MCRSHADGGRRCPTCTPGSPEYKEASKLANANRRKSRAQRRAVYSEVLNRYGDTESGREAAAKILHTQPRNIPGTLAFLQTLDPELADTAREAALDAGDEAGGSRQLAGSHNQNTMNDRHARVSEDYYEDAMNGLRPDPNALNRIVDITSSSTLAYLDSEHSKSMPAAQREALTDAAMNSGFIAENVGPGGTFITEPGALTPQQRHTMLNMQPEDAMHLGYVEDAVFDAQRNEFMKNATVEAEVRPLELDSQRGFSIGRNDTVADVAEIMRSQGREYATIREGVALVIAPNPETGEMEQFFEVDRNLRLPAGDNVRVDSATRRIPKITDFTDSPDGEGELDNQHISAKRLTSKNTEEGRNFREQLSREVIRASYASGKDVGQDAAWMVNNKGKFGVLELVDYKVPGKRGSVTAATVANVGLKKIAGDGGFHTTSDALPTTSRAAIAASMDTNRKTAEYGLMKTTKYTPRTQSSEGTTARGHQRAKQNPKKTTKVAGVGHVSSDKQYKHHKKVMAGLGDLRERTDWTPQEDFSSADASVAATVLKGRSTSTDDLDRMIHAANTFDDRRTPKTKQEGGDALLMSRVIDRQRAVTMKRQADGDEIKPTTMVTEFTLPKGQNPANFFREGRQFTTDKHMATSVDGTGLPRESVKEGTPVRMVMSTTQGVPLNGERSVIPSGSSLRVAHYVRDEDGTVTAFMVDEDETLAAAEAHS